MFRLGAITGSNSASFNPENDIPSLNGKVILVTGGSAGLGKQAVTYLARHSPSELWLTAPTIDGARTACADIQKQVPNANLKALQLDLASFDSIKEAATTFLSAASRLDTLMLNAGVMGIPAGLTENDYEIQFGINYLGHALLTKLLLPLLNKTANADAEARIITITSYSHWNAPEGGILFDVLKTTAEEVPTLKRYGQSKMANILFARQLAKEHPKLTVAAIHPGAADTELQAGVTGMSFIERCLNRVLYKLFIFQPVEITAKHQVWAATTQELESGQYFEPLGVVAEGRLETRDDDLAQKLWDWTEQELQEFNMPVANV